MTTDGSSVARDCWRNTLRCRHRRQFRPVLRFRLIKSEWLWPDCKGGVRETLLI